MTFPLAKRLEGRSLVPRPHPLTGHETRRGAAGRGKSRSHALLKLYVFALAPPSFPSIGVSINFHRDSCEIKSGSGLGTISDGKLGGGWERGGRRCMCVCVGGGGEGGYS